ncbi:LOW QUALITY PROTEIN: galactose-3-O-sulfotransferase 2 [Xenentodon cancila]
MPPVCIYISILQEPLQTFKSIFSYYTFSVPAFQFAKKAAGTKDLRSALSVFLGSLESFWDPQDPDNCLGNPMSFDFGLDSQETFRLVMIAEHDESLVLLGSMLKLGLEELAYVHLNIHHNITCVDEITKDRIQADVQFYEFFLQLFREKAEHWGLERLKEKKKRKEVDLLRASKDRITQKSVARKDVPPVELEDFIRPQTDCSILGYHLQQELCMRLVLPELQYHAHLYFKQYGRSMRPIPTE